MLHSAIRASSSRCILNGLPDLCRVLPSLRVFGHQVASRSARDMVPSKSILVLNYSMAHEGQETLQSIQAKAGAITRRSAGIPALMASILAADPSQLFPRAMNDLVAEATLEAQSANIEESRLPQVHALNCIKEFFTTSRLNVASEAYIGQGLELAARTLNSNM